jgi:SAM-dependent methyltransferase
MRMSEEPDAIGGHYAVPALEERILAALEASGKNVDHLVLEDLAPVDAFHVLGRAATEELAGWVAMRETHRVLDVGCGIGGTCRHLAATFGCHAIGIDLTEAYCRTAQSLSRRTGFSDATTFAVASALALPIDDEAFEIVWTEHVQMNLADKQAFYSEMWRVLRPGGHLVFNDVFGGEAGAPIVPVPWASGPEMNHLVSPGAARALLGGLGAVCIRWEDRSEAATLFFERVVERLRARGWPPLGLHLLMGADATEKLSNMLRNLREGRIRVVQAVLRKPTGAAR